MLKNCMYISDEEANLGYILKLLDNRNMKP